MKIDPEGLDVGNQHPHSETCFVSSNEVRVRDVLLGQIPPAVQSKDICIKVVSILFLFCAACCGNINHITSNKVS